jgi:hypothetical protein
MNGRRMKQPKGECGMVYDQEMRQFARELMDAYGPLVEVRCVGHIELEFANGHVIRIEGPCYGRVNLNMMKYGYHGTGAHCFHSFLDEAGFNITFDEISEMKKGTVLRHSVNAGSF